MQGLSRKHLVALVAAWVGVAGVLRGQEPRGRERLSLSVGAIDVGRSQEATELGVELLFRPVKWELQPIAGAHVTTDQAFFVLVGLRRPVPFGGRRQWAFVPSFAVSYYEDGKGKELGYPIEFRSGGDLLRKVGPDSWLGIGFYHLSNSALGRLNPGTNALLLRWVLNPHKR